MSDDIDVYFFLVKCYSGNSIVFKIFVCYIYYFFLCIMEMNVVVNFVSYILVIYFE